MAQVTYVGPHASVVIAAIGKAVKSGETVEVDSNTAKALVAQGDNWQAAKAATKSSKSTPQEGDE